MALQTQDEIIRVFDEYQRGGYAPPDLILDADNGKTIFEFVVAKWGIVSITYLRDAEKLLGSKLKRKKQPTKAELAAKETAKQHADYLKSLEPQTTLYQQKLGQDRLDANKKDALAKEFKNVLAQIETEIGNFSVGHASGHQDYSGTDSGKQILRSACDQYDRRTIEGARRALSAVRTAKSKL
jgi:hypothetical protein